ncbi:hypothetical protein M8J76_011156 [Diaphorina citri]|nr:hypothetical protein M8J76_011156 [Diaphorina citri]
MNTRPLMTTVQSNLDKRFSGFTGANDPTLLSKVFKRLFELGALVCPPHTLRLSEKKEEENEEEKKKKREKKKKNKKKEKKKNKKNNK